MIAIRSLRHGILAIEALEIRPGITSVIGPNGSGKTTLLRLLAGIDLPSEGTLLINGKAPRNAEIGWVNEFPDRNILFETVTDEVASSLRFRHVPCTVTDERVARCLDACGLSGLHDRSIRELSGGEKILVAFAAAIVHGPELLILDECDSHLDETCTGRLRHLIRQGGIPYVVQCTQQMEVAAAGDRVICLDEGQIVQDGPPDEVFSRLSRTPFCPLSRRCRA